MNPRQKKRLHDSLGRLQNNKCFYCACKMVRATERNQTHNTATIEHIIPQSVLNLTYSQHVSRGNIVLACRKCNKLKGSASAEWLIEKLSGELKYEKGIQ